MSVDPAKKYGWMKVFKVGTWKPKSGPVLEATSEVVDLIVNSTKAKEGKVVPFVVNHPKQDNVSFGGWNAANTRRNGDYIEIMPETVVSEFAEMYNAGKFKGVSVKIGRDYSLEHLGFLTDNPPAVKGLPSYVFEGDEDGSGCFEFSENEFGDYRVSVVGEIFQNLRDKLIETNGVEAAEAIFPQSTLDLLKQNAEDDNRWLVEWMHRLQDQIDNGGLNTIFSTQEVEVGKVTNEELQEQLNAEKQKNAVLEQQNTLNKTKARTLEFEQFFSSEEMKGKITPASKSVVLDILKAIDGEEKLEFSSGGSMTVVEKFQEFLKTLPPSHVVGGVGEVRELAGEEVGGDSEAKELAQAYNKSRGAK